MATLYWTDGRGREQTRPVNDTLKVADFRGRPGHALLLVAANPHLSISELEMLVRAEGIGRSRNWVHRRRWLFEDTSVKRPTGGPPNADGKDQRAIAIMREHPTRSARELSRLLAEHGIRRGKDWVMKHRCD